MECRAYGICLDSQSRGYLGKDRKVSSAAGGNLSRMHKTQETAKESRLNFMYSHLRNRTLVTSKSDEAVSDYVAWKLIGLWCAKRLFKFNAVDFPKAMNIEHDMIDPSQKNEQTQFVYPLLISLLNAP